MHYTVCLFAPTLAANVNMPGQLSINSKAKGHVTSRVFRVMTAVFWFGEDNMAATPVPIFLNSITSAKLIGYSLSSSKVKQNGGNDLTFKFRANKSSGNSKKLAGDRVFNQLTGF